MVLRVLLGEGDRGLSRLVPDTVDEERAGQVVELVLEDGRQEALRDHGLRLAFAIEVVDLDLARTVDEAAEFREGGGPSALARIVTQLFDALDLIQFFTAGEKETRAWTLRKGETALDAAAAIHTDIARGFIRCEVMRADDLIELGSRAEVAKQGKERLEGKTYVVQDGDVLNIRFSPPSR